MDVFSAEAGVSQEAGIGEWLQRRKDVRIICAKF